MYYTKDDLNKLRLKAIEAVTEYKIAKHQINERAKRQKNKGI